jgi:hypothetical protein
MNNGSWPRGKENSRRHQLEPDCRDLAADWQAKAGLATTGAVTSLRNPYRRACVGP